MRSCRCCPSSEHRRSAETLGTPTPGAVRLPADSVDDFLLIGLVERRGPIREKLTEIGNLD
ncbi:hypothetical protein GCM10009555_097130 [Acrocarpospora macrocephala]